MHAAVSRHKHYCRFAGHCLVVRGMDLLQSSPLDVASLIVAYVTLNSPRSCGRLIATSKNSRQLVYRCFLDWIRCATPRIDEANRAYYVGLAVALMSHLKCLNLSHVAEEYGAVDNSHPLKRLDGQLMHHMAGDLCRWMILSEEPFRKLPNATDLRIYIHDVLLWRPGRVKLHPAAWGHVLTAQKELEQESLGRHGCVYRVTTVGDASIRHHLNEEFGTPRIAKVIKSEKDDTAQLASVCIKYLSELVFDTKTTNLQSRRICRRFFICDDGNVGFEHIEHGGLGGHWSNEHAAVLDVAESVKRNDYMTRVDLWQWLPTLFYDMNTAMCEAVHDVDCDIDDGRITDAEEWKRHKLVNMAGVLVRACESDDPEERTQTLAALASVLLAALPLPTPT